MPLYGHELSQTRNAAEAGFARSIANDKDFIGSVIICDPDHKKESMVGITLDGRRAARAGDLILSADGAEIGTVTSGSISPSLGYAIAMGYVPNCHAVEGNKITIQTARKALPATITSLPIYKDGTARKKLLHFL
jgi:aminomethyltransferase